MQRDSLMFYCQHLLGMGHLVRGLEVASALASDWKVTFVTDGVPEGFQVPETVELASLPPLENKTARIEHLLECFRRAAPEALVIELFPFGRKRFAFELIPLLEEARKDGVWIACSLRDILVRRPDQDEYEARVCDIARKYFDLVLVHGDPRFQVLDESFSRVADLGCPVVYTGYVHRGVKRGKPAGCASLSGRPTIVGSIGAGKCESGHHLLDALISAAAVLEHDLPHQFEIFTGPFMAEHDYARLAARVADLRNVTLSSYTPDLAGHLSRSDLSVSMGGYNTVMDVLAANVRALVYPVIGNGDNEQRVRAEKLAASGALEIIETADLLPERLAGKIRAALQRAAQPVSLDMDGARKTRELIHAHLGVCSR
jgi:predicted glycosyltransferase